MFNLARGHYSYVDCCPKAHFPYYHYPKHFFSQIGRSEHKIENQDPRILFVVLMDFLCKQVHTTKSYRAHKHWELVSYKHLKNLHKTTLIICFCKRQNCPLCSSWSLFSFASIPVFPAKQQN